MNGQNAALAAQMIRNGNTDDEVEHQTGASLLEILQLRAEAASSPLHARFAARAALTSTAWGTGSRR